MGDISSLKDALDAIGLFIGTYGLAVFLVVYYAVKLYPELRQERGEWIKEITKLRELVDPATRPLTKEQAKTVLLIISDSFINRFALFGEDGFLSSKLISKSMPYFDTKERVEHIHIFNEEFEYYPDRDLNPDERVKELHGIFHKIKRAMKSTASSEKDRLIEMIKTSITFAKSETSRLALLGYGDSSLESIWKKVQENSIETWIADYPDNSLTSDHRYNFKEARQFLEKHPAYAELKDMIEKELDGIRFRSGQERFRILQGLMERNIEKELSLVKDI